MKKIPLHIVVLWALIGLGSLGIFIRYYSHVMPVASIDIHLDRVQASARAKTLITSWGFDLTGYEHTVRFHSNYYTSAYLQKTQGIKKSNELIARGVPVWVWRVRWFKELQKEGYSVDIHPATGEVIRFSHFILDDAPGASLQHEEALSMARRIISARGISLDEYVLKDSSFINRKHRIDHFFAWEKAGFSIEQAHLRVQAAIYGDRPGNYEKYLKVPETFHRFLERELSLGTALYTASRLLTFILSIWAVFMVITHKGSLHINWKFGIFAGCIVACVDLAGSLNSIPLSWYFYKDTVPKLLYFTMILEQIFFKAFTAGLIVFAFGSLGGLFSKNFPCAMLPLLTSVRNRSSQGKILPVFVVGYALGFIFLGYVTLFYRVGMRYFDIWMFPVGEYSNILSTAIPLLFPLTVAVKASLTEEFTFRFFSIPFLSKYMKSTALALVFSSIVWAFAHSTYPVFPIYARGIELTVFGVIMGLVFLSYGLETVIIAHFVMDAVLAGMPLLRSHNSYFIFSGVFVVSFALLPFVLWYFLVKKNRRQQDSPLARGEIEAR